MRFKVDFLKFSFSIFVLILSGVSLSTALATDTSSELIDIGLVPHQEDAKPISTPKPTCETNEIGKEIDCPGVVPTCVPFEVQFQVGAVIDCLPTLPTCTPNPYGDEIGCIPPVPTCTPLKNGDEIGCQNIAEDCVFIFGVLDQDCSPDFNPALIDERCTARFGCRYVPTPTLVYWEEICLDIFCALVP